MTTHVELAADFGTDLSSRSRAAGLRRRITDELDHVVLDFSGVFSVSPSFADELIAVMVSEKGEAWFRDHVRLTGLQPLVRESILEAVAQRTREFA